MSKIQRNDPCPCGSGLKYKKCCGSVLRGDLPAPARIGLPPNQMDAKITLMGLAGAAEQLHLINRFVDGDARNAIPMSGTDGQYQVTFVLARPGFALFPERQFSFANGLKGNSHLAITKPAFTPPGNEGATEIRIYARTEDGAFVFTGFPNEKGFLGKITSAPFRASNRNDAEEKAYRALSGSLSNWSIHLDIPLEIAQLETVEIITGNIQTSIVMPNLEAPFSVAPTTTLTPEFRGYAGLYREALGSSSPVYRFLCLYKILEGVRARRKRIARRDKKAGKPVVAHLELLPKTEAEVVKWLNAIFPIRPDWDAMALASAVPLEVRGREITSVIDDLLAPLRIDVAHALLTASEELTLSVDELLHVRKINRWLSFTKCIVRRVLKNEFPSEFLSYLKEDGAIVV